MPKYLRSKRNIPADLNAACWIKIIEHIDQYDGKGSRSGWIWKVCENVILDWQRREARRQTIAPMTALFVKNPDKGTDEKEVPVNELPPYNPWYRRIRQITEHFRGKRWALCPECGKPQRIVSGKLKFKLECGHTRPNGLKPKD
jgi:DNA-directed RNA polymerase specialized sigma24 family protein